MAGCCGGGRQVSQSRASPVQNRTVQTVAGARTSGVAQVANINQPPPDPVPAQSYGAVAATPRTGTFRTVTRSTI